MHAYACTHAHIYTHIYTHACTHAYTYVHIHTHVHIYTHIKCASMHTSMHASAHMSTHTHPRGHLCTCLCRHPYAPPPPPPFPPFPLFFEMSYPHLPTSTCRDRHRIGRKDLAHSHIGLIKGRVSFLWELNALMLPVLLRRLAGVSPCPIPHDAQRTSRRCQIYASLHPAVSALGHGPATELLTNAAVRESTVIAPWE